MGIKKRKTVEVKSHKKLASGKKQEASDATRTVMAKMVFDQDHFETEQDVRDWIEKAEWDADGVVVTDDGNGSFVARPADTTDESFTRMAKVDAETPGVEAYVGEMLVKSADEDDEDEDDEDPEDDEDDDEEVEEKGYNNKKKKPMAEDRESEKETETKTDAVPVSVSKRSEFIAKAKSSVSKFSGWDAFYSKKSTLVDALKAGMEWDATPPGFYDVQAAFNGVIQSILSDDAEGMNRAEALSKAAADYADLLAGMDTFFDGYLSAGEEVVSKSVGDKAEKIAKWAEGYAKFVGGESEAPAPAEKSAVKKAAEAPAAIDHKTIAELVAKAVEPLAERVAGVAETVSKIADRRPTKKASDVTDSPSGEKESHQKSETAEDWLRQKQRKSLLGG